MMTKIKFRDFFLTLIGGFSLQVANAQSDSGAVDKGKFTFNGYVDVNYYKNLNNPMSGRNDGISGAARAFDKTENMFGLGLVQGKMTYTYKNSTVVADMVFGPHADLGNYGNAVSFATFYPWPNAANVGVAGNGSSVTSTSLAIKQAYITHAFSDKFSITAGQFGTHVGYEVIDAPLNFHYSLSNLFNNGPFYHIGLKAEYAVSSKVGLMAGIVNGWDNLYDNNSFKTAIAQVKILPSDKLAFYVNYLGGNDDVSKDSNGVVRYNQKDATPSFKQLIDLVVNYQITDKFYFGFNGVMGALTQQGADMKNWGGAAVYLNYAFSDMFTLGGRADYFDNTAGVMYIGNTQVHSFTVTGKINLADGHLMFKPEVRMDIYGNNQFCGSDGVYNKNSQITVGAAAIYKF